MRTQEICFPNQRVLCVFPRERSELTQAISELWMDENSPVIVLIGGAIDKQYMAVTRQAIQTISRIAEDMNAVVICGGTDMGVMAEIGRTHWQHQYKFPLIGVAPEELVAWPGGPQSTKFLWWGEKRWPLEPHYSHFILVPGNQFGDESPWIVDAASTLSNGCRSVTILINGGEVSRKDIKLSLESGRPVIALSHTGRLADEMAGQLDRDKLVSIVPAEAEQRLIEKVRAALLVNEGSAQTTPSLLDLLLMEAYVRVRPDSSKALSVIEKYDYLLNEYKVKQKI